MRGGGLMLVPLLFLAGCAGSTEQESNPLEANLGVGVASVTGSVLSDTLEPIDEALVQIDHYPYVGVNEGGAFVVRGVPEGDHVLYAGAPGYTFLSRPFRVDEGQALRLDVNLEPLASVDPYVEIVNHNGFSFCDTVTLLNVQEDSTCNQYVYQDENDQSFSLEILPSWQFVITEVSWDPNFAQGADSMRVAHAPGPRCSGGSGVQDRDPNSTCYGVFMAGRYVKLEGHPGPKSEISLYYDTWEDYRNQPYPDGPFELFVLPQWAGWAQPVAQERCDTVRSSAYQQGAGCRFGYGAGISTGITIRSWVSIFHNHRPDQPNPCCPTTEYTAVEG